MGDLDYSGADTVHQIIGELHRRRGVSLVLCSVDPVVCTLLDAYGLTAKVEQSNVFATTGEAAEAYQRATAATP